MLDFHPKVKHWVRNIPQKPQSSFWLPTHKDYFYPDFIAELHDGSIFVLEYKGGHIDTADDARIKNDVGKQWAKDSDGKRIFLMAKAQDKVGRSLEEQINEAIGKTMNNNYQGMRWLKCDLQVQTPEDSKHW